MPIAESYTDDSIPGFPLIFSELDRKDIHKLFPADSLYHKLLHLQSQATPKEHDLPQIGALQPHSPDNQSFHLFNPQIVRWLIEKFRQPTCKFFVSSNLEADLRFIDVCMQSSARENEFLPFNHLGSFDWSSMQNTLKRQICFQIRTTDNLTTTINFHPLQPFELISETLALAIAELKSIDK